MDEFEKYIQFQKEVTQATIKVIERFQQPGCVSAPRKTYIKHRYCVGPDVPWQKAGEALN